MRGGQLFRLAIMAALLQPGLASLARADWQPLVREGERRVDVDTARLSGSGLNPTAWSRLTLSAPMMDEISGRRVRAIEMQSLFDCQERRVATLARIYQDDAGKTVRTERFEAPGMAPLSGTTDQRLFERACRETVARGGVKARASHADLADGQGARVVLAADDHGAAKPAASAAASAPAHAAPAAKAAEAASAKPEAKVEVPTHGKVQLPAIKKPLNPEQIPVAAGGKKPANPEHVPAAKHKTHSGDTLSELPRKAKKPKKDAHGAHPHWSYDGETGPEHWAKLSPEFATCSTGTRQSPIDVRGGVGVDLPPILFEYQPAPVNVVDNGHTIQVNFSGGNAITVQGRRFELVQFHFHKPSEERINGKNYDMVAHLVHKDGEGKLGVIALLFERGGENAFIQTVWNNLPLEQNSPLAPQENLDLNSILPKDKGYYTYMGSLTTPPCTEGVLWMVMKTPVQMSSEQMSVFARLYKNNVRPIQKSNGRLIKESR